MEQDGGEHRSWAPSEKQEALITWFAEYIKKEVPVDAWHSYKGWCAFFEEHLTRLCYDIANTVAVDFNKPHPQDFVAVVGLLKYEEEVKNRWGSRREGRKEEARKMLRKGNPVPDVEAAFCFEFDQATMRKLVRDVEREGFLVSYDGEAIELLQSD